MPPFLYQGLLSLYRQVNKDRFLFWEVFDGDWKTAAKQCSGYEESSILEKVKDATAAVIAGKAAYEKDAVLFEKAAIHWPLVASLQHVFAQKNQLGVVDFGGALGSTYHQHKRIFNRFPSFHWTVVEQENYVTCGKENFTTEQLSFEYDIASATKRSTDVILFSCVLHYLEDPFYFIQQAIDAKIPYLIIDSTPFSTTVNKDIQTIQYVPSKIYKAKYPCYIFAENPFMQKLLKSYTLIWEWDNQIEINIPCRYKGMLLQLK